MLGVTTRLRICFFFNPIDFVVWSEIGLSVCLLEENIVLSFLGKRTVEFYEISITPTLFRKPVKNMF